MSRLEPRVIARLGAGVLVVPAAALAIGANWALCLLIAAAGGVLVVSLELPGRAQEPNWPVPEEVRRSGHRREVTTLSWMLTSRHGGTDRIAVLRLRAIAAHRLALRGIDLYNAADAQRASELIGPTAHWLLATDQQVSPSHRQMVECVDAIERLDPELPSPNGRR